ncbi:hypothetical protein L7F22_062205 [Adiantum nelumboides]|nr:hypothetical protein [Adiantum nelumboides]
MGAMSMTALCSSTAELEAGVFSGWKSKKAAGVERTHILHSSAASSSSSSSSAARSSWPISSASSQRWCKDSLKAMETHLSLVLMQPSPANAKLNRAPADVPLNSVAQFDLSSDLQAASAQLPHGWEQHLDLKTGRIYYINWETCKTSYNDPRSSLRKADEMIEGLMLQAMETAVMAEGTKDSINHIKEGKLLSTVTMELNYGMCRFSSNLNSSCSSKDGEEMEVESKWNPNTQLASDRLFDESAEYRSSSYDMFYDSNNKVYDSNNGKLDDSITWLPSSRKTSGHDHHSVAPNELDVTPKLEALRFEALETFEKLWEKLCKLRLVNVFEYGEYGLPFTDLRDKWVATLAIGKRASDFLKRDIFVAGLCLPLKDKALITPLTKGPKLDKDGDDDCQKNRKSAALATKSNESAGMKRKAMKENELVVRMLKYEIEEHEDIIDDNNNAGLQIKRKSYPEAGMQEVLEMKGKTYDYIRTSRPFIGTCWTIVALKAEYFLEDSQRMTKQTFIKWVQMKNKGLTSRELLREFEKKFDQLSMDPAGELGLTNDWDAVLAAINLLVKRQKRIDKSIVVDSHEDFEENGIVEKIVEKPKASSSPTLEGKEKPKATQYSTLDDSTIDELIKDENEEEVKASTNLWPHALRTAEAGKVTSFTLRQAGDSIRETTGWTDPVDSLSVYAYIAKAQANEAFVEDKRKREDEAPETSKRQTRANTRSDGERMQKSTPIPEVQMKDASKDKK